MKAAGKKVGITGAAGNVGATLRQGLSADYALTLYDLRSPQALVEDEFVQVDCGDPQQLAGIFDGLDVLIHLAGDPSPDAARQSTLRNNFRATSYVFEEVKRAGVKKLIFASSNFYHQGDISTALRGNSGPLITLDRNPTPQCLYGESKVFGENVGRHLSHLGIQFAALRIGWTVPQDNPALYGGAYMRAVFCSHRDLVAAFSRALEIDQDFLVAFAVSNNGQPVFDLTETSRQLGFFPQDNAEDYFR